jgi:tRNA_anti-like
MSFRFVFPVFFLSMIFLVTGCNQGAKKTNESDGKKTDNPSGVTESNKKDENKPDFAISSEELAKEFHVDADKAKSKYKDKIIEVTGEVWSIAPRPDVKDVVVVLHGAKDPKDGEKHIMIAMYPDQTAVASKLSRNQKVKIFAVHNYGYAGKKLEEIEKSAVIMVSSVDLAKEFGSNPEAAKKKYNEKADIIVSGELEEVVKEGSFTYAKLKGDGKMRVSFTCQGIGEPQKGQIVHIRSELPRPPSIDGKEISIDSGTVVDLK